MNVTLFRRSATNFAQVRPFSVAYNVKSKFEQAYKSKMESMSKVQHKP